MKTHGVVFTPYSGRSGSSRDVISAGAGRGSGGCSGIYDSNGGGGSGGGRGDGSNSTGNRSGDKTRRAIVGTLKSAGQGTLKNDPTRNGKGTAEGNLDSTENECRTKEMNN